MAQGVQYPSQRLQPITSQYGGYRMKRQGFAQAASASVTPQQVQQGLFGMLALILTLLICQQYQHWTETHRSTPAFFHSASTTHFSPALVHAEQQPATLRQVDRTEPVEEHPQQPRWVF